MERCVDSISLTLSILAEWKVQIRMCATTKLYKDLDWLDTNCVISQVCEASWGDFLKKNAKKKPEGERRGRVCVDCQNAV